jgi:hypothetical protein
MTPVFVGAVGIFGSGHLFELKDPQVNAGEL